MTLYLKSHHTKLNNQAKIVTGATDDPNVLKHGNI